VSASVWWIVAVGGSALAIGAALLVESLARRRLAAEALTVEVQHLLGEQRTIADALQRALLPDELPAMDGAEIVVRYRPGEHGLDLGGDWYDVIPLGEQRFFFVVGDVSGRGVSAGATMASLRFAIRAFVSEGHGPGEVLSRLAAMVDDGEDGERFATALCAVADVAGHQVTFANAGHLPALLVGSGDADYVAIDVGPPIGVPTRDGYRESTVLVPPGATVLVYTDGLVERRDEGLDRGLERLRDAARAAQGPLNEFVDAVIGQVVDPAGDDDTAVLAVRWPA
jgi:serine phosphatase RsbU (regulator of sigma subunit)